MHRIPGGSRRDPPAERAGGHRASARTRERARRRCHRSRGCRSHLIGCPNGLPLRFTDVGPAPYASALAEELEEQGVSAEYEPPLEQMGLSTVLDAVTVVFAVSLR